MKKKFLHSSFLLVLFFLVVCLESKAQGIYQLWGTTSYGGPDDQGVLFSTKYDGSAQAIKRSFITNNPGDPGEGNAPLVYNNKFYSILRGGGLTGYGIISEYDPATNVYSKKADLFTVGAEKSGSSLVEYNGKFYGLSYRGGITDGGILFEFNPVSGMLTKRHEFIEATGHLPLGDLVVFNNKLYGVAGFGGANNDGVVFEFNPVTNIYTKKKDFLYANTGSGSKSTLIVYSNKLWGVSDASDGPDHGGYIFSYDPLTNVLSGKVELGTIGGVGHYGYMAILNNKFYGVTDGGGANNLGLLFQFDPATSILTKEMDFNAATTSHRLSMIVYNNLLYGASAQGGPSNAGVLFSYNPVTNLYSNKVVFTEANGGPSQGRLTLYNNKMYLWTKYQTLYKEGRLNEYDPANNSYTTKIMLGSSDLFYPGGQPIYHNNKIYGSASYGGNNKAGGIYEYNIATNNYTIKVHLDKMAGQFLEQGSFTVFNNKFYGVTVRGGVNNEGILFEYDPLTNVYTKRYDFGGINGKDPYGKLVEINNKLYGTTRTGGLTDQGTIFEYNPVTNTFTSKVHFDGTRGKYPTAGLTVYNGKVYGVAASGGATEHGTLFEYLPLANGLIKKADFNLNSTGEYPVGNLTGFNNKLYGLTSQGDPLYAGKIFEFDIASTTLTKKIDLLAATGDHASSGMTLLNNKLYGMTNIGGDYRYGGVLFQYDPAINSYTKKIDFEATNGRLPRRSELIPVPALTAPGSPGSCINTQTVNITAANANEWIPYTDAEGRAVAEINANGNILGNTTVRVFVNGGNIRQNGNGVFYLDRNITITPTNQPATPVSIRLYIRKSEFDALKATAGSGVAIPADLAIFKNSDFCTATMNAAATPLPTVKSDWATDYVYSTEVSSFSSFYFARNSSTLPVHLLSFTGKKEGAVNHLNWTATCTNDVKFTVERSSDGINFLSIGTVTATQQDCNHPFTYPDPGVPDVSYYYRIKMDEYNGPVTYSKIVFLNRGKGNYLQIKFVPNPVTGPNARLQVESSKQQSVSLSISDMTGRVILQKIIQAQAGSMMIDLELSRLGSGTYNLRYSTDGNKNTVRFIKL